ncbi:MAG: sterol desaturase family protein [Sphingobacteriales bacterium]|nr:sterol desaturase family protein [Sphingobacteriales bacterium]OJY81201.1 MAG: sterol desaturase [Sphingobacteriales bacterium 44-15]
METYGKILLVAMPVFLALVLFEKWYGWVKGNDTVRTIDMVSSLTSGVTNVTKDVLGLSVIILSYGWMLRHLAIVHITHGFFTYLIAFLVLDFAGYWTHRIAHEYNFFWNNHIIHHSSEEFNLACALRQSISGFVKMFTILLLPAALLGVPEKVIAIVAPLHLFAQFWYHTRHIGKMGFLEKIIVTPSHHRVHHAINKEYLDKNYGQIFIFWDKWFGSFQEELATVQPVYGITRPAATWNPIRINFQHLRLLIMDAWRTQSRKDKFRIWLMPTGWRPPDVEARYPVRKIEDVYYFEKYDPAVSGALKAWLILQLLFLFCFITYFFGNIAAIGSPGIFIYGGFIFLYVYAFMELADGNPYAIVWEILKGAMGTGIVLHNGNWFGAAMPGLQIALLGYFIVSVAATGWFVWKQAE